jgi:prepilin-type N-terminal cleavage/methylation domain-containing protein
MSTLKLNKGFTLIELSIVIVIVGILATVAVAHYRQVFEKGRAEEAKQNLWEIRVAWGQYVMDHRDALSDFSDLALNSTSFPRNCRDERYFRYSINDTHAIAVRCTSAGKPPQGKFDYQISLNLDNGTWSGVPQ